MKEIKFKDSGIQVHEYQQQLLDTPIVKKVEGVRVYNYLDYEDGKECLVNTEVCNLTSSIVKYMNVVFIESEGEVYEWELDDDGYLVLLVKENQ